MIQIAIGIFSLFQTLTITFLLIHTRNLEKNNELLISTLAKVDNSDLNRSYFESNKKTS